MQKYLLPIGFYDLLEDEAKVNQETIDILLNSFYAKNYQLIKTPLVEFEESLFTKDEQTFKTVDNFSGKTLVIRSDITPQIARLVATRLRNSAMPLRLCYVGDVLKTKTNNLYSDRQLTQVGAELIGENSCSSNLEIIEHTLSSLKKIKLSNLLINFCCPQFLDILLKEIDLESQELKDAINQKNISVINNLGGKFANHLTVLTLENDNLGKIFDTILQLPTSDQTKNQLSNWQETLQKIKNNHPEIKISADIFGDEEFSYHNQIGFTIFSDEFSYPIARGGRYLINDEIPAIGSTIYINNLRRILIG